MRGNISVIGTKNERFEYYYDNVNRLEWEYNSSFNWRKKYEYDSHGNIIKETEYEYDLDEEGYEVYVGQKNYTYDTSGRLINFNGQSCTYNALGNPITYRGKTLTWYGRQLTSYNGTTFTYDGMGRRKSKGSITFTYDYAGNLIGQSNGLKFFYDSQGVAGIGYNDSFYYYRKDAQGNIIAILDSYGNVVVNYYYDAWGNHTVSGNTTLGNINPFRYRGYYYDTETKLYYLQTRYYDPETHRFLNMDSVDYADPGSADGLNLYAYCGNNPVMNVDPTGEVALEIFFGALLLGTIFGIVKGVNEASSQGEALWKGAVIGGLKGLVLGGAIGLGGTIGMATSSAVAAIVGLIVTATGSFVAGMGIYTLETQLYNKEFSTHDMVLSGLNLSLQASANYGIGYLFGRKRMYKQAAKLNFSSPQMFVKSLIFRLRYVFPSILERTYLKLGTSTIFSMIVNGIIQGFFYN